MGTGALPCSARSEQEKGAIMPKRCGDPECANLVNERKSHVRIGDKVFCGAECARAWLTQNNVFEAAADPFAERQHTTRSSSTWKRMNGG